MLMKVLLKAELDVGIRTVAITGNYTPPTPAKDWHNDVCDSIDGIRANDPVTGAPVYLTQKSAERVALAALNLCARQYDRQIRDVRINKLLECYA